jgi:methyl halide transferase
MKLDKDYWEERYRSQNTGWDIGHISYPLKTYIDQLQDKDLKILIPGAGNAYEAEYLFKMGFQNTFILDFAALPLQNLKQRFPEIPAANLIKEDFFEHTGKYDLILEQTFFCALPVNLRSKYAEKTYELLKQNGKIAGLFFDREFESQGPPFGGSREEYLQYFHGQFSINVLETCYNSIPARQGNELFFIFKKN